MHLAVFAPSKTDWLCSFWHWLFVYSWRSATGTASVHATGHKKMWERRSHFQNSMKTAFPTVPTQIKHY